MHQDLRNPMMKGKMIVSLLQHPGTWLFCKAGREARGREGKGVGVGCVEEENERDISC